MSITNDRQQAGEAYAAAAKAYVDAYVELHAYDLAVGDAAMVGGGFGSPVTICGHSEFLRDIPDVTRDPASRATARLTAIKAVG